MQQHVKHMLAASTQQVGIHCVVVPQGHPECRSGTGGRSTRGKPAKARAQQSLACPALSTQALICLDASIVRQQSATYGLSST